MRPIIYNSNTHSLVSYCSHKELLLGLYYKITKINKLIIQLFMVERSDIVIRSPS